MSPAKRKILFIVFVLIFLISAPAVVLYTMGYRLNPNTGNIEQRGALVIKSLPEGARIYIRGREIKEKTPAIINLAADEYEIEIRKEKYLPWKKRIAVASQITSFAEDIILWPDTLPETAVAVSLRTAAFSPDRRFAITVAEDGVLDLFDLVHGHAAEISRLEKEARIEISFSRDGYSAAVLSESDGKEKILTFRMADSKQRIAEADLRALGYNSLVWGEGATDLLGIKNGYLASYNIFTGREERVAQSGPVFILHGTEVWSIMERADASALVRADAGILSSEPQTVLLLPKDRYQFENLQSQFFMIRSESSEKIFVIDPASPQRPRLQMPGLEAEPRIRNGSLELLTWNDFELWIGGTAAENQELLRRQSDKIKKAVFHPAGGYVIYGTKDSISALEIDPRDRRNLAELVRIEDGEIETFAITAEGNTLYFAVSGGAAPGIYRLPLK